MAKLYPPIIEEIVPAFYGTGGLSVPYTINRAVGVNEIKGFALIVKSSVTNKEIYTAKQEKGSYSRGRATVEKVFVGANTGNLIIKTVDARGNSATYSIHSKCSCC